MTLLVTLTVDELRQLVRDAVRVELAAEPGAAAARDVMTCTQAAEYLQLHPKVVARFARGRGLPGQRVGREWRFRRADLDRWIDGGGRRLVAIKGGV